MVFSNVFHRKNKNHNLPDDKAVKKHNLLRQITYPSPRVVNSQSTPNLKLRGSNKNLISQPIGITQRVLQDVTNDPKFGTQRVKKSKSQNFLNKILRKNHAEIRLVQNSNVDSEGDTLDAILNPYEEIFIPIKEKRFSDSLMNTHPSMTTQNLNNVPQSTQVDIKYCENSRKIMKSASTKRTSNRVSKLSISSNILQDLSSLNIEPHELEISLLEHRPFVNDLSQDYSDIEDKMNRNSVRFSGVKNIKRLSILNYQNPIVNSQHQFKDLSDVNESTEDYDYKIYSTYSTKMKRQTPIAFTVDNEIPSTPHSELKRADSLIFDENYDLSHSTSRRVSVVQSSEVNENDHEKSSLPYTEFETIKDVKYQVIKNYCVDSHVKIISPGKTAKQSDSIVNKDEDNDDQDSLYEFKRPLELPKVDFSSIDRQSDVESKFGYFLPQEFNSNFLISKDEMYRAEMLLLIETHAVMLSKKQEENSHLKQLLFKERQKNSFLSSPQRREPSSVASSPVMVASSNFNNEESKKIRKKFIPIDITITQEPKPRNYLPFNKETKQLLPAFEMSDKQELMSNIPNEPLSDTPRSEFNLKPFRITTPKQANVPFEQVNESDAPQGLGIFDNKRESLMSMESCSSSVYFTANESFFQMETEGSPAGLTESFGKSDSSVDIYTKDTPGDMQIQQADKRDFTGSTTLSSLMSKPHNSSNDSILNSSMMTNLTTPDSLDFNLENKM